jgi:hypothetical protein
MDFGVIYVKGRSCIDRLKTTLSCSNLALIQINTLILSFFHLVNITLVKTNLTLRGVHL